MVEQNIWPHLFSLEILQGFFYFYIEICSSALNVNKLYYLAAFPIFCLVTVDDICSKIQWRYMKKSIDGHHFSAKTHPKTDKPYDDINMVSISVRNPFSL